MLRWSITLFIIALIAAVLGFGGIAGAAAGIAENFSIGNLTPASAASMEWQGGPAARSRALSAYFLVRVRYFAVMPTFCRQQRVVSLLERASCGEPVAATV